MKKLTGDFPACELGKCEHEAFDIMMEYCKCKCHDEERDE